MTEIKNGTVGLAFIWRIRLSFWAEGDKLWAEGNRLRAEGDKLRAEGNRLRAEGDKLWAEGDKLRAEGDKLWAEGDKVWAEGVIAAHGNIKMEWRNWNDKYNSYECHLETGEIFSFKEDL